MHQSTRKRLLTRYRSLQAKTQPTYKLSKRITDKALLPQSNCSTRGAVHWR